MMRSVSKMLAFGCVALVGVAVAAQRTSDAAQNPSEPANGEPEIVVHGYPPRCHPRPGDPQDAVEMSAAASGHRQVIRIEPANERYALVPDDYPSTGPEEWQRAAIRMDHFVFRVPTNGDPICIGTRTPYASGEAQLRRAFAAKPYWGKYMVLSAFVATRNAVRVDMWIAAGAKDPRPRLESEIGRDIVAGGFKRVPIIGNYSWQQVNFLLGPIPCMASQISYGVELQGGGNVWLAKPSFVEVPEDKLSPSMKLLPHGEAMLRSDPICGHYLRKERLYVRSGGTFAALPTDADLYPQRVLYRWKGGQYQLIDYPKPGLIEF